MWLSWRLRAQEQDYTALMAAAEPVAAARTIVLDDLDDTMMAGGDDLSEAAAEGLPAQYLAAESRELPLAFEYALPRPADIASGGDDVLLPLFVRQMEGEFFHYAVPRHDGRAYLVCRAAGDSELLAQYLEAESREGIKGVFPGNGRPCDEELAAPRPAPGGDLPHAQKPALRGSCILNEGRSTRGFVRKGGYRSCTDFQFKSLPTGTPLPGSNPAFEFSLRSTPQSPIIND